MRALVITDIHANSEALRAVLATPEAQSCERVYSLGDQLNFGPQPRETLQLLREAGAVCLLGNHEERLQHIDSPEFAGYNWALLHWTHRQLPDERFDLPLDVRVGPVLMTHAVPGDPWKLLHEPDVAPMLDGLPQDVRLFISGHNHCSWQVRGSDGRMAVNAGSLGMAEIPGEGCKARYAVLEVQGGDVQYQVHSVPYDVKPVIRAFAENGSAAAAPQIARAVLHTMLTGTPMYVTGLMRHVSAAAQAHGLTLADEAAWRMADEGYCWPETMDSAAYWRMLERDACE